MLKVEEVAWREECATETISATPRRKMMTGIMIKTILVPLDGSALAEEALPQAERLARATESTIVVLQVVRGGVMTPPAQQQAIAEATQYLQAIATNLTKRGCPARTDVFVGQSVEGILLAAATHRAEVIVMSTHGLTGLRHAVLGSVAEDVVRGASVPVLLVQAGQHAAIPQIGPYRKILVPLDGTPGAERTLTLIAGEPFARSAEIVLLHSELPVGLRLSPLGEGYIIGTGTYVPQDAIDEADQETQRHTRAARAYLARVAHAYLAGHACRTYVPLEEPAEATVHVAVEEHVDLIAMTTHARKGLERLREGSVAAYVVGHAGVPVLLLHQADEVQASPRPIPISGA
jgi:nucleotide-binding universal stress UspA family protein